ncbi:MAG: hypothetical protein R2939_10570 [Kofleriaceae bacterium]
MRSTWAVLLVLFAASSAHAQAQLRYDVCDGRVLVTGNTLGLSHA